MEHQSADLILKGGHVIDPANQIDGICDMAVKDKKIFAVGKDLSCLRCAQTVDVSGLYVVPGLIDMHCHAYPKFPLATDGLACIEADAHMFQQGVTTCVDAGTCGIRDFYRFKEDIIDHSQVRLLAMVNISHGGMVNLETEQDPDNFHPAAVAGLAKAHPELVVAIKTAHYWVGKPFDATHPAWASVDATVEAAALCGLPAMVDFQPTLPGRSYEDLILKKLRAGDIHTHVFAQQFPILDGNGQLNPALIQARERGVLFDLGHGAGSFWFRNAVPAFAQGFVSDTLSTDLYFDNVAGPVFGLTSIMSKYWNIGMGLNEIIYRTTKRPAQVIGRPSLGDLSVGSCADVAVLEARDGKFGFADGGHARMAATKKLECVMTLRAGKIVYDLNAISRPDWQTADASYWCSPGILP
ncbi:amidohydrolase/deacetylase family metallohydrolase [Hydrogenoanaerobacterium sp.]|uniref:amidohydrolase/deacetylase family metallohydrolase n=1 Tax=Hydrogenoanaerobacterium sp. TaxID=2953763 RepID=UPI0028A22BD4|nr:amidohydrolase/deacetylase family metallohydrolase [Hydrogenoanaerobacterium sp.]